MSVKLVVFDLAGTTVKDNNDVGKAFQAALSKYGYVVPLNKINPIMGYEKNEAIAKILYAHEPETSKMTEEIFELYEKHGGDDYIGEPVSQIEHMSQAAALATAQGHDEETILAAFFHDIGHLCAPHEVAQMDGMGNADHEKLGAEYLLERGFSYSSNISSMIALMLVFDDIVFF